MNNTKSRVIIEQDDVRMQRLETIAKQSYNDEQVSIECHKSMTAFQFHEMTNNIMKPYQYIGNGNSYKKSDIFKIQTQMPTFGEDRHYAIDATSLPSVMTFQQHLSSKHDKAQIAHRMIRDGMQSVDIVYATNIAIIPTETKFVKPMWLSQNKLGGKLS